MASVLSISPEEEFRQRRPSAQLRHRPDLLLSLSARVERGFQNSTGKVIADLAGFGQIDDSNAPKLSVPELLEKFPGVTWTEAMTEEAAAFKHEAIMRTRETQRILDEREQGMTSTIMGFGAELLTAAAFSPETYVAPIAGRVLTSTTTRFALHGFRGGNIANTAEISGKAAKTIKKFEALQKQKFLAGAAEDGAITALLTERLFQKREEILNNPQGAMDYWGAVAASAAISGAANSILGRFVDSATMSQHVMDRSKQLALMITGQEMNLPDPVFRRLARREMDLVEAMQAVNPEGRVRIFHDNTSNFHAARDKTTGDIILNTAKVKSVRQMKSFLNNPGTVASLKDGSFNFKQVNGDVHKLKLPSVYVDETGIRPLGTRKRNPPEVLGERHDPPGMEDDPAKSDEVLQTSWERLREETATFEGMAPEEQARLELEELFETDGLALKSDGSPVELQTDSENPIELTDTERNIIDTYNLFAEQEASLKANVDKKLERFGKPGGKDEALRFFREDEFDKLTQEDKAARMFFREAGITPEDLVEQGSDTLDRIQKHYAREVLLKTKRRIIDQKVQREMLELAELGRAEVQARLDGSLIEGGTFFEGQGSRNVFRNMEVLRNKAGRILHGSLARHGLVKYLDNYNDDAKKFFKNVERSLAGDTDVPHAAADVAEKLGDVLENQRILLNRNGAGIRKLDGFFLHTVHDRSTIVRNENAWKSFMLDDSKVDWDRMGVPVGDRLPFVEAVFKDIQQGHLIDSELDLTKHGGKKGEAFARSRSIHFKKGQQVEYNDLFGRADTAKELLDQIELRAKAIAITDEFGYDFKKAWGYLESGLSKEDAITVKKHFDEITGEANIAVNQDIASYGDAFRNLVNAISLQGSGITIAISDIASQIVGLYSTGMASSIGRSVRMVQDSYMPAIRALRKNQGDEATLVLKNTILPIDSNLQAMRKHLGDTAIERQNNIPEKLSLNVIKWSGSGVFTKISQLSSLIGAQRGLARAFDTKELSDEFINTLKRFDISKDEFLALPKDVIRGDQLSVFHIENSATRRKFTNLLDEAMRLGSLQADPRQAAFVRLGTKRGTFMGEAVRGAALYLPTAAAVHQKMLMRLAIMGKGDARFLELVKKGRRMESLVLMGIMLGSATAIVTIKDLLKNREPFWAGDKPLNPDHMYRVLKVAGIAPLITEFSDVATGGMAGQMARDLFELGESAGKGDLWDTVAKAKDFSPIPWTNAGPIDPISDAFIGMVAEEYLRDTLRKQRMFEEMSGQGQLIPGT